MATILLCGGGTAGHILPLLAVAEELKKLSPDIRLIYVGEKNSRFKSMITDVHFDQIKYIPAGKFRRYHNQNLLLRIIDVNTLILNIRDFFRFLRGLVAGYFFIKKARPDAIFIKGGFVGVPVGISAARLKIPYITHDSDSLPGLANRLIAKHAALHATGLPEKYYSYPKEKTRFVGVPIRSEFRMVGPKLQSKYRRDLKINESAKVILVTGGSLGALRLNNYFAQIAKRLLENYQDLIIVHSTGVNTRNLYSYLPKNLRNRTIEQQLLAPIYKYSGAADLIITRAGATSMAEFATQKKPCIIIPNPQLTGGHQSKNAQVYDDASAAVVIEESQLKKTEAEVLYEQIDVLLKDSRKRELLASNIAKFARQDSSKELAEILLGLINKTKSGEL